MPSVPPEWGWPSECFECGASIVGSILCCGVNRCHDCHVNHERSLLHAAVVEDRLLD